MDWRLEEGPHGAAGRGSERIRLRAVPRSDWRKTRPGKAAARFRVRRRAGGCRRLARQHVSYRAVYTVRFAVRVFVLHVFQKKSKSGIATPKPDLDLIKARLKAATKRAKELEDEQT